MATKLRDRELFSSFDLLMIGDNGNVAKGWFRSSRTLRYDSSEGLFQPLPSVMVDCIVAANALERVADHRLTLCHLDSMLSARGLMFLSYASPLTREATEEWGLPNPRKGSNLRVIGRDFEEEYARLVPDSLVMRIDEADPVTGDIDVVYLLTKNALWMHRAINAELDLRILD